MQEPEDWTYKKDDIIIGHDISWHSVENDMTFHDILWHIMTYNYILWHIMACHVHIMTYHELSGNIMTWLLSERTFALCAVYGNFLFNLIPTLFCCIKTAKSLDSFIPTDKILDRPFPTGKIPTFLSLPSKYTFSVTFVLIPPFFLRRRNISTWDPSIPSGGQLHTVHVQRVRESHFTFHSMDQRFYQCLFSPCIRVKSTFSGLKHFLWGIKSTLVIFLLPISRKNQQAKWTWRIDLLIFFPQYQHAQG